MLRDNTAQHGGHNADNSALLQAAGNPVIDPVTLARNVSRIALRCPARHQDGPFVFFTSHQRRPHRHPHADGST